MRASEFIAEDLNEDWKKTLGAVGAAGALALGAHSMMKPSQPAQPASQTIKVTPHVTPANPHIAKLVKTGLQTQLGQTLSATAKRAGMHGAELAQFLAQCAHETQYFQHLKEKGGKLDFKKYDIRFNPRIANALGNDKPGDGAKYAGRGYLQITGKDNYQRLAKAIGIPVDKHPEMLEKPDVAAKAAVYYWQHRVKPHVKDFANTQAVTKPINSSLRDLQARHEKFRAIGQMMGLKV